MGKRFSWLVSRLWLHCLLLGVVGAVVRAPALQGEFLWDDGYLVPENPLIRSPLLILEAFRHYLFPDSYSGHYRPVQTVSYIFDYFFWGNDPYGYHLANIFWHVAAGIALYLLLRRLLPTLVNLANPEINTASAAFGVAFLWMVHPMHSAAIDYISGRADSLACFFSCAAWIVYLRAREIKGPIARCSVFAVAAFSGLLALCSRETAALWLLLFLVHLFGFEKGISLRNKVRILVACLALAGAYVGLRHLPESRPDHITPTGWTAPTRAVLMLRALGDYSRLMFVPTNLHMERNLFEPANYRNLPSWRKSATMEYLSLGGLLLLAIFIAGVFRRGNGRRTRAFGAIWFLLTYLPTSNLFELNATVAEHWLYLPSIGFLIFAAGCMLDAPIRFRRALPTLVVVAVLALGARSFIRSTDWVDPETFFRRTFAAGGSSSRIGVNLAFVYSQHGQHAKAETILRKVLLVSPDYPLARMNLAVALSQQGKLQEARELLATASQTAPEDRSIYPRTWDAALNLARMRHHDGDDAGALALVAQARLDYPGTWEVISYSAELLRETKGPAAALPLVEEFARTHWWHARSTLALGRLYSELGQNDLAAAAFHHASRLDVHDAEALNLESLLNLRQGNLPEARQLQEKALARQPLEARQYLLLSEILTKMDRPEEARLALAHIDALRSLGGPRVAAH